MMSGKRNPAMLYEMVGLLYFAVFGLRRKNQFTWAFSSCSLSLAISLPTR